MHKLGLGYTRYFNHRYKRTGSLFQGAYKAKEIKTDELLIYISAYINGNAEIHKISKAKQWSWSSYYEYLGIEKTGAASTPDVRYLTSGVGNGLEIEMIMKAI